MKREIKFRAWDKKNNKFLDPKLWAKEFSVHLQMGISVRSKLAEREDVDVFQIELMQYTGLKDKNGKEIYEGDVVSYKSFNGNRGEAAVTWEYGCFNLEDFKNDAGSENIQNMKDIEIIGNVHENPELLEGK